MIMIFAAAAMLLTALVPDTKQSVPVASQAVAPVAVAAPGAPVVKPVAIPIKTAVVEPIICHSSIETGSLVRRKKVCLTRKQWSYVNDTNHDQAQQLIDDNRSKGGSN